MHPDQLPTLLDQIYDTVLDPTSWPGTLTAVSQYIGASFMSVVPYDDPSAIYMSKGGEHAMAGYTGHWYARDAMVKVGIDNKNSRALLCDWSSVGIETIKRDSYYQEFRRDVGIGFCLGTTFEAYPGDFRALGINLPLGQKILDHEDLTKVDAILRHLARSITLSSRTQDLQITVPAFSEVLERIQCGAAVVDSIGRVVVANHTMQAFSFDGLTISSNRLNCAQSSCQADLNRLIQNACSGFSTKDGSDFALIARPSGGIPLLARAVPLSRQATEGIWRKLPSHRRALLLVVDIAAEKIASCEQALKRLGLTFAEAKVAALVGNGLSPRQAASKLGTAEGTVRNQLKQVFSKLELTRQSDLARAIDRIAGI